MIAAGNGGRIVLIGSINSRIALAGQAAYCSSKGGVAMLGAALAVDWARHGIAVNTIGPGVVDTPMSAASLGEGDRRAMLMGRTPLGRPAAPGEIAAVVSFLTSPDASYMTGAYVPVDGGWLVGLSSCASSSTSPARSAVCACGRPFEASAPSCPGLSWASENHSPTILPST